MSRGDIRASLGERRHLRLAVAAEALEISEQELIRRALDAYLPPVLLQIAVEPPPDRPQAATGGVGGASLPEPGVEKRQVERRVRTRRTTVVSPPPEVPPHLAEPVEKWLEYKRERGETYKPRGLRQLLMILAEWGPVRAIAAVDHSMRNNWAGLFEPKHSDGPARASPRSMGGGEDHMRDISAVGSEPWEAPDCFAKGSA